MLLHGAEGFGAGAEGLLVDAAVFEGYRKSGGGVGGFSGENPGGAAGAPAYQDAVNSIGGDFFLGFLEAFDVSIAEESGAGAFGVDHGCRPADFCPICLAGVELAEGATVEGDARRAAFEEVFQPFEGDWLVVAGAGFDGDGEQVATASTALSGLGELSTSLCTCGGVCTYRLRWTVPL